MSLAMWLRAGRAQRGMTLESVAKITKIQPRILERLEGGKLDGLPAEVFVRGFVRSVAKCVGLDEAEAMQRFTAAITAPATPTTPSSPAARALVESMAELAPQTNARTASPRVLAPEVIEIAAPVAFPALAAGSTANLVCAEVVETMAAIDTTSSIDIDLSDVSIGEPVMISTGSDAVPSAAVALAADALVAEASETTQAIGQSLTGDASSVESKKKRGRRGGKSRAKRKSLATGTPSQPTPVVVAPVEVDAVPEITPIELATGSEAIATIATIEAISTSAADEVFAPVATTVEPDEIVAPTETWSPKMPVVAPSVPWRRPAYATSTAAVVPTLVIDDADPDSAERELEDRVAAKEPRGRSFLPPILMDREDRSGRQGGLTLAVIILLIAATLTLSYLMRRPSSSGDGVTLADDTSGEIVA